jgi:hypothetical protein
MTDGDYTSDAHGEHAAPGDRGPGWKLIFRPYRTLPNGRVLWARQCGLRAWPIWVRTA